MKWFDIDGFLEYMQGEFPAAMKNPFTKCRRKAPFFSNGDIRRLPIKK